MATESTRRSTTPLVAAVAATTVAIGVTAASLLGWLRPPGAPRTEPVAASSPIADMQAAPPVPDNPVQDEPAPRARHHEHDEGDDGDDD